jgi:F-type H+-transporting ATPase subunit epsilon
MMHLQVLLPTEILVDRYVYSVTADGDNGSFGLLPRHVDFVTVLRPGILTFTEDGPDGSGQEPVERYVGVSEGILVKSGRMVLVSVVHAAVGTDLHQLRDLVRDRFVELDEIERVAVSAVARLEADFVRRFLELEGRPHA